MRQVWISVRNLPDLENSITEYYSRNPHMQRHTRASVGAHVQVCASAPTGMCAYVPTHIPTHAPTCLRMCTHIHAHAHAHEEISGRFLRFSE